MMIVSSDGAVVAVDAAAAVGTNKLLDSPAKEWAWAAWIEADANVATTPAVDVLVAVEPAGARLAAIPPAPA